MGCWYINQLFMRGSYTPTKKKKKKNKQVGGKTPFFIIDPFCLPHPIFHSTGFDRAVSYRNVAVSIESHKNVDLLKGVLF